MSLPKLEKQPVNLRVAHVVNPRHKSLDVLQLAELLESTRMLVKTHFGIEIEFEPVVEMGIDEFFRIIPQHVRERRQADIVDTLKIDKAARDKMRVSVYDTLKKYEKNPQHVLTYARPWLTTTRYVPDLEALSDALVETMVTRLSHWHEQRATDGKPVLDGLPYNEWVWWDSVGYGELDYDLVITNQLVASAETYGMSVHSALRGGITAGTTSYSKNSRYGTYAFVMVYPLLNHSPELDILRGDTGYTSSEITRYSAAILVHELGHLLYHYGHPFANKNCIMAPMPLLAYRRWYDGLNADACKAPGDEQMRPGAAKIDYHTDW